MDPAEQDLEIQKHFSNAISVLIKFYIYIHFRKSYNEAAYNPTVFFSFVRVTSAFLLLVLQHVSTMTFLEIINERYFNIIINSETNCNIEHCRFWYIYHAVAFLIMIVLLICLIFNWLKFMFDLILRIYFDINYNYFIVEDMFCLYDFLKKIFLKMFNYFKKTKQLSKSNFLPFLKNSVRNERFIEKNSEAIKVGITSPINMHQLVKFTETNPYWNDITSHIKYANFHKTIRAAKIDVHNRAEELKECIDFFGIENVIAAVAYSLERPQIYKSLNEMFRLMDKFPVSNVEGKFLKSDKKESIFKKKMNIMKTMASFLGCSPLISHLADMQQKANALPKNDFFYRGYDKHITANKGDIVTFCSYTSTSSEREVAEKFIPKEKGTLFKFTGILSGLSLKEMSYFPNENEVLLFPYQTFVITEMETIGNKMEMTLLSTIESTIQEFDHLNCLFPFKINDEHNPSCTYSLDGKLFFTSVNLAHSGYSFSPSSQTSTVKNLPPCHVIRITYAFTTKPKPTFFSTCFRQATVYLVPNIETLVDCCKKRKKLYLKQVSTKVRAFENKIMDVNENFEINQIDIYKLPKFEKFKIIDHCKKMTLLELLQALL